MDYQCKTRSNYFAIREGREAKLKALLDHCGLRMWKENDPYGVTRYAFSVDGDFVGIPYRGTIPEEDPDGCGGERHALFQEPQGGFSEGGGGFLPQGGGGAPRSFIGGSNQCNTKGGQRMYLPGAGGRGGGRRGVG